MNELSSKETPNAIELVQHDLKKGLTPTKYWRTVIELSVMINNNEIVVYSEAEIVKVDQNITDRFGRAMIALSRPVFEEEQLALKGTRKEAETTSQLTKKLDAIYKLGQIWSAMKGHTSFSKFIEHHIAFSYYDCMSGGMPTAEIDVVRRLLVTEKLDPNTRLYPSDDGWHTIADFLKETEE